MKENSQMSILEQLKGNVFYFVNKLATGPLLFLLPLSDEQNLYSNSDHIFFMATTYHPYLK